MKYTLMTAPQLLILSVTISVLSALLISLNMWIMDYRTLPMVYTDNTGTCIKVENFENGHAFNCNDVDVILRRYRTPHEKIPTPSL